MEAVVIHIHGRQVCKLVDVEKVEKAKLMRLIWANEALEIKKKELTKFELIK